LDGLNRRGPAVCRLEKKLEDAGFVDVQIGQPADTFGGAGGEKKARLFEVFGYPFLARKP
jgi:hypothetical protein